MSDIMFPIETGGVPYQTTEHYLRRVLTGDIRSVRNRLIAALERLGYDILDDEDTVLRGRRGARGWAPSYASADVLDYAMTLVVRLREQGDHATRVTFDYLVKHPSLNKGEKEILTREAEAISALATVRPKDKVCSACGTESTDDSRFCRKCGAKLTVEVTELEILRMSAEIRAGHTSVVSAFVGIMIGTGLVGGALLVMLLSGTAMMGVSGILLGLALMFLVLSAMAAGFGWNRVNRSLKPASPKIEPAIEDFVPPTLRSSPASLIGSPPASVTERTTNLLAAEIDVAKTGEFETDKTTPIH